MPRQWVKEELKRNEIAVFVSKVVNYFIGHREQAYTFLAVAGSLIVLGIFFIFYYVRINAQALERLSIAQSYTFRNSPEQALPVTDDILKNFSYSRYIPDTLFIRGEILYQLQKFSEAEEIYKRFLKKYPKKKFAPFVLASLGNVLEEEGKYDEALATFQKFLNEYGDHFLAGDIFYSEARIYELLKQSQKAKEVYEKIILLFPDSYWKNLAEKRLTLLTLKSY